MKNIAFGLILVLVGFLLLLDNLGVLDFFDVILTYWPIILIIAGIYFLLRNFQQIKNYKEKSSDLIHYSSVFENIQLNINSKNFKGGSISTLLGDIVLDISQVELAEGEHMLRVSSVFGDLIIKVPEKCNMSFNSSTVIGSLKVFNKSSNGLFRSLKLETSFTQNLSKFHIITSQIIGDLKIN